MRVTILHNPTAGDEDHGRDELEALLRTTGHELVTYRSLKEKDWEDALEAEADVIVVAGGDGSVRKIITAIGPTPTVLAVLALGSANNIARSLGLDVERPDAVLKRSDAVARRFDVWEVTSESGERRCVEAVGGGLFAQLLDRADDVSDTPSGPENVDFGMQLLAKTLAAIRPRRWTVEIDGSRVTEELLGVEAMNIRELGPNIPFAPAADCGDGLIDVVMIRPDDGPELAAYVAARLKDEDHEAPAFDVRSGRDVVLEPPDGVPVHVDDSLPTWHREAARWVKVSAADADVRVLVPA